jgi:acetyltransferase-like isoleucine patch superfamily enzyme
MDPGVFVHPQGLCESDTVGAGTRVWAFAHVLPGARVGTNCNICDHAFVEGAVTVGDRVTVKNAVLLFDGVTVGDDVFLGPNCVFTNDINPRSAVKKGPDRLLRTVIEAEATVGANATIVCGVTVKRGAFIGAGAVVVRDVPAFALMVGNPARRIGWMCACGERLDEHLECACGERYHLMSETAGLRRHRASTAEASNPWPGPSAAETSAAR